ncbi:tail fiber domain-containing protein [Patescibacteria group bacterium]|nr:tail fiber domain-containing protein [Patescibacteria group bacterium]
MKTTMLPAIITIKRIAFSLGVAVLTCLTVTNLAQASDASDIQPASDVVYGERLRVNSSVSVADSSYYYRGIHLGSTDGTGGVIFANGSIINVSGGSTPVTFGDDLRIDGRIWRGPTAGPGDNFPVKIYDDLRVDGQIWGGRSKGNTADGQSIVLADTVRPALDNINDFGAPTFRMRDGFFSGTVNVGNLGGAGVVHEDNLSATNDPQAGYVLAYNSNNQFQWVAGSGVGGSDTDWTGAGTGTMYATTTSDNVGIGLSTGLNAKLHVYDASNTVVEGQSVSAAGVVGRSSTGDGVKGHSTSSEGGWFETASGTRAVYGQATDTGSGVHYGGYFTAGKNSGIGVLGSSTGSDGAGVYGSSTGTGSSATGVSGMAASYGGDFAATGTSGLGVRGQAVGTSGVGIQGIGGYYGGQFSNSGTGGGVGMQAAVTSGSTFSSAVLGINNSTGLILHPTGHYGGYFSNSIASGYGVYATASGSSGIGVYGSSSHTGVTGTVSSTGQATGYGVSGTLTDTSLPAVVYAGLYGGLFTTNYASATALSGSASNSTSTGVYGYGGLYGGDFYAANNNGAGVRSRVITGSGAASAAVFGLNNTTGTVPAYTGHYGGYFQLESSAGFGVYAKTDAANSTAVHAYNSSTGVNATGGYFETESDTSYAVYGLADGGGTGTNYGGYFKADASSGTAVYGTTSGTSGTGVDGIASGSSGTGVAGTGYKYGGYFIAQDTSNGYSGVFSGGNFSVGLSTTSNKFRITAGPTYTGIGLASGSYHDVQILADGTLADGGASSIRLKDNVENLTFDTASVLDLQPVSFTYKESGEAGVGLIAEDVEQIMPELVTYDEEGRVDGVRYRNIPLYLLQITKDQQTKIEVQESKTITQENKNTAQDKTIEEQKNKITELENEVSSLKSAFCRYLPHEDICQE